MNVEVGVEREGEWVPSAQSERERVSEMSALHRWSAAAEEQRPIQSPAGEEEAATAEASSPRRSPGARRSPRRQRFDGLEEEAKRLTGLPGSKETRGVGGEKFEPRRATVVGRRASISVFASLVLLSRALEPPQISRGATEGNSQPPRERGFLRERGTRAREPTEKQPFVPVIASFLAQPIVASPCSPSQSASSAPSQNAKSASIQSAGAASSACARARVLRVAERKRTRLDNRSIQIAFRCLLGCAP